MSYTASGLARAHSVESCHKYAHPLKLPRRVCVKTHTSISMCALHNENVRVGSIPIGSAILLHGEFLFVLWCTCHGIRGPPGRGRKCYSLLHNSLVRQKIVW